MLAMRYLRNRMNVLLALPVARLDKLTLTRRMEDIGRLEGSTTPARSDVA